MGKGDRSESIGENETVRQSLSHGKQEEKKCEHDQLHMFLAFPMACCADSEQLANGEAAVKLRSTFMLTVTDAIVASG